MGEQNTGGAPARGETWIGVARLALGLAQGVALYGLYDANLRESWPATDHALHAALYMAALFVPLIVIGGLGALRPITLGAWAVIVTAVLAGLGWYDVSRAEAPAYQAFSPNVFAACVAFVFVGHHLIAAGDEARRWIAPYERYFDLGWRHGAQLALAGLFTGAFWLVLFLGSALFDLINVHVLRDLIREQWFAFPATSLVFAAAIHVTDLRSGLVRGFRALGLMLLSWLAPVMTLLAAAFLATLPFTGLRPLWDTRAATSILLGACVALVVLINATYQDGDEKHAPGWLRQWGVRIAAALLTPLALLAAYALYLRVAQYGLTPERIYAGAVLVIGAFYAVSYLAGSFWRRWMAPLERGNIIAAFVILAVCLALFTPIADPARLSVNDQMRRLADGRVSAEALDLRFLRFEGANYGLRALERLRDDRSSSEAIALSDRAAAALALGNRWESPEAFAQAVAPLDLAMHPADAAAPASFLGQTALIGAVASCRGSDLKCHGALLDIDGDRVEEMFVTSGSMFSLYGLGKDGKWLWLGDTYAPGEDFSAALERGEIRTVPSRIADLAFGEARFRVTLERNDEARAWVGEVRDSASER